jgi:hypothetical protein
VQSFGSTSSDALKVVVLARMHLKSSSSQNTSLTYQA